MATTLRSLLLTATASVAVLGTALTLRATTATGQGLPSWEVLLPARDECGAEPSGMPPSLGSLLRMLSAQAGCAPPPG
ncbi:hypothetical protein AB0395_14290 [Streptosporangium sp. NPDC051023]|uniref:hypothetical protein n=1 Tax=Streptosporangium sp. NPDC051023 TaxID=3155410 RepID=UPI00344FDED5